MPAKAVALTQYYRVGRDYYRLQIVQDPDCASPRDADNGSILITRESRWESPDPRDRMPECLRGARDRWQSAAHDFVVPFRAVPILRYARSYLSAEIYAIAALRRSGTEDLYLDFDPHRTDWVDGLAIVTKASWEMVMGDQVDPAGLSSEAGHSPSARELLEQDLAEYNRWQRGECYGYQLERAVLGAWDHVDSCWGFIGEPEDYVLTDAKSTLPEGAVQIESMPEWRSSLLRDDPETLEAGDRYLDELAAMIEGARFVLCEECGKDLDQHLIGPDPLGKPHAWCLGGSEDGEFKALLALVDRAAVETMTQALVEAGRLPGSVKVPATTSHAKTVALNAALDVALTRWPEIPER